MAGVKGAFVNNINSIGCFVSLLLVILCFVIYSNTGEESLSYSLFFIGAPLGFFFLIRGVVQSEQKDD